MEAAPIASLDDYFSLLENLKSGGNDRYTLHSILLSVPSEQPLEQRLDDWMYQNWGSIDFQTGPEWLFIAMSRHNQWEVYGESPQPVEPAQLYNLARQLKVLPNQFPALYFFHEPSRTQDGLILELKPVLGPDAEDNEFSSFFRDLSTVVTSTIENREQANVLAALRKSLERQWPEESEWRPKVRVLGGALLTSVTVAGTFADLLLNVKSLLGRG